MSRHLCWWLALSWLVGCQGEGPLQPGDGGETPLNTPELLRAWGHKGTAPGEFWSAQGIAIDSQDHVYVIDSETSRIQKFDAAGGFLTEWGQRGSAAGEFQYPRDIAIDRNGKVYIADLNNNRIQVFDANGRFLTMWGSRGTNAGELFVPGAIAIDGSHIFVADVVQRVQRFTLEGRYETGWSLYDGSIEMFPDVFDIAVDADGDVWIVEHVQHRVRRFDADGRLLDSWDRRGASPGAFQYPHTIALDGHDHVIVVDESGRAQMFDRSGAFRLQWKLDPPCRLYDPAVLGVAVSRAGHIFTVDAVHNTVLEFVIPLEPSVRTWWSWGGTGVEEGSFGSPFGIDVAADGRVYVGDSYGRVEVFEDTGAFLLQIGSRDPGEGALQVPMGVTVVGERVYVVDRLGSAVVIFDTSGRFVDRWVIEPEPGEGLPYPRGIAFDPAGNAYVTATQTRIEVLDASGAHLRSWGEAGSNPGQFRSVSDVGVDSSGTVYVTDTLNRWIGRFDADGTFRDLVADASGSSAGNIDVTPDGQVFAATGSGVRQYGADGRLIAAWGNSGRCEREFNGIGDIAVDDQGRVFVVDSGNYRVQVFTPPYTLEPAKNRIP